MKKLLPIILTSSALLLSGCAGNIKLTDYSPDRQFPPTNPLPTKAEINAERARVVIFEPEIKSNKIATQAKLDNSIAQALDEHISATGTEIIDRSIAQTLKKELQLAEIKGLAEYTGPNIADYAITGKITEASLSEKFVPASQYQNDKGETFQSPASCKYSANFKSSLRLYKLPALHYLKTVVIEDVERMSKDAQGTKCSLASSEKNALFRAAANNAVEKFRVEFKNFFAPKGYILERRIKDDESIFKISKGSANGFNIDDTVKLYHLDTRPNPLTGEANASEDEMAIGTITNLISDNHAWVLVDDENAAGQIKLGDYARVFYEKSMFETAMGYADTAMAMTDGLSSGGRATQVGVPAGGAESGAVTSRVTGLPFQTSQVWEGTFYCNETTRPSKLRIKDVDAKGYETDLGFAHNVNAVLQFDTPEGITGAYKLHGKYYPESQRTTFSTGQWIKRPSGYGSVSLEGNVTSAGKYSGKVTNRNCGGFGYALARSSVITPVVTTPTVNAPATPVSGLPFQTSQVWDGTFYCNETTRPIKLRIKDVDGKGYQTDLGFAHNINAVFQYETTEGITGAYKVHGKYIPESQRMTFSIGQWIKRPAGHHRVGLEGTVTSAGNYSGKVPHRNCGGFETSLAKK